MKANTVTLPLDRYHELLSFEAKKNEKKKHTIYISNNFFGKEVKTDKDAVAEIAKELKESEILCCNLKKEIESLKKEIESLKKENVKEKNFFKYIKLFFK